MTISDKLAQIKNRADSLNEKTDQLNSTIKHIENVLNGTGVEFWWFKGPQFDLREFPNDEERLYAVLGYTRIGTEWRIAVQDQREIAHATGRDPKDMLLDLIGPARTVDLAASVKGF